MTDVQFVGKSQPEIGEKEKNKTVTAALMGKKKKEIKKESKVFHGLH